MDSYWIKWNPYFLPWITRLYHLVITSISSLLWHHSHPIPIAHLLRHIFCLSNLPSSCLCVGLFLFFCNDLPPYHHLNLRKIIFIIYIWRYKYYPSSNRLSLASHPIFLFLYSAYYHLIFFSLFPF